MEVEELSSFRRARKFPKLKLIGHIFRREQEIRKAVWEVRNDSAHDSERVGGGSSGKISSPTEMQAIKAMTPIRKITLADGFWLNRPEDWLKVVDYTYKFFTADDLPIFQAAAKGVHYKKACRELGITHGTYYNMLRDGQNYAIAVACQLGLINIIKM